MNNKIKYSDEVTLLNFHEHNRKTMLKMGYENQYDIGYPKFYKEWQELVKSYPSSQFKGVSTIVIFSRGIHPIYMDKENYINLFVTTFKLIREKLGDILIVIKPHPREDTNFINEILIKNKFNKYVFSNEDASLLATNAFIAISFWTSAILASLASRVPSIEYYIESKRFRESEPRGSVYKKLGIDSVDNAIGLENFIEKVLNKEYQIPPIIGEISKYKNINFVNKF